MPRDPLTQGEATIKWIEDFCVRPDGRAVRLTAEQRALCYSFYDAGQQVPIAPPLGVVFSCSTIWSAPRRRLGIRRLPLPTRFRCGPRLGPSFVPISRVRALGSPAARWEQAGHRGRWRV